MRKLSHTTINQVINSNKPGMSYMDIATLNKISISKAYNIFKNKNISTIGTKSGPKKKLSSRKETLIINKIKKKEFLCSSDATKWLGTNFRINVSGETVRKTLKS